ncbi:MAG: sugar ABC transporter ATP-binding protein [Planctomycetota bacterium]|nr:MAG: sugar ABC transporter ATP-binding protein [Planctomycetota bacterium]
MSAPPIEPRLDAPALLKAECMSKRFGPVQALDRVDFELRAGEVHALMGENGAGKSTLIKCLTGVHRPDSGRIYRGGRAIAPASPRQAEREGISTVYQEVNLIPHLSIAENIALGREPTKWGRICWGQVRRRAQSALDRLGLGIDVSRELSSCSIAIQQLVAIARALDVDARVLILDEPTSSLDRSEVARLFDVMQRLRGQGLGILFVTHFLDQVYAISDRISVLRDGRLVGVHAASELPRQELVSLMVGRELDLVEPVRSEVDSTRDAEPVLCARALSRRGSIEHADIQVASGETVGLAGLLGSGRTETARLLFGVEQFERGELLIGGHSVHFRTPRQAIRMGLAMTPENRKDHGIIPSLSVRENIELALRARGRSRLTGAQRRALAERFIRMLNIRTPTPETPVSSLSGGNQQKVLLARWLATEPRVLILDEPTRGIDVAAKAEILREIDELRRQGMAIIFISSELEEVVKACGRVVVLRDRRTVAELTGERITEQSVLHAIAEHHD